MRRVEPVPRLREADSVDRGGAERQAVAIAGDGNDGRITNNSLAQHSFGDVEGDDTGTPGREGAGRQAGAGAAVEHVAAMQTSDCAL